MYTNNLRAHYGQNFIRFFQYVLLAAAIGLFSTAAMAEKININQADAETLQYIPGIGPGKSAKIVKLRDQIGGFKSFDELLDVSGIGEKTLEEIKNYSDLNSGVTELTEEMLANPPRKNVSATNSAKDQISG